jgi:hypothetical protein
MIHIVYYTTKIIIMLPIELMSKDIFMKKMSQLLHSADAAQTAGMDQLRIRSPFPDMSR